eukprot:scaffold121441_cov26-Tisochrysis_lutea.AAC.1
MENVANVDILFSNYLTRIFKQVMVSHLVGSHGSAEGTAYEGKGGGLNNLRESAHRPSSPPPQLVQRPQKVVDSPYTEGCLSPKARKTACPPAGRPSRIWKRG